MAADAPYPALFLSHGGGPSFFLPDEGMMRGLGKGSRADRFLRSVAREHLPAPPKAIVVVSAHWESAPHVQVRRAPRPLRSPRGPHFPAARR